MDVKRLLFTESGPVILVLCICLVQHPICSTELEEVSENVSDVVDDDLDYAAEEAAREELLRNEQHDSLFSGRRKYLLTSEVMLENGPIWRDFWNEWKEKKLTLRKSITDVILLCKHPKNYKILVDCNSTSLSISACVDAEKGTIAKCNNSTNAIYSVRLCMEVPSRKIVACGKLATAYLCVPNITTINGTKFSRKIVPIRPCHHEERQICLGKDGAMDLCQTLDAFTTNPLKLKKKDSEIFIEYNNLTEWWKEWDEQESIRENLFKNLSILCRPKAENDFLVECKSSSNLPEACIEVRSGKIKQCTLIKKKDMPISICIEESNKIASCEDGVFAFLCFSKYRNIKSITPCRDERRHACLYNGSVLLCTSVNQTKLNLHSDQNTDLARFKISSNNSHHYNNSLKAKNVTSRSKQMLSKNTIDSTGEHEGKPDVTSQNDDKKQITICRSRRNRVVFCNSTLAYSHLCVTMVRNVIGNCKSFNATDKPMPVCVEEISKRIVICDDGLPLKYLCFEERQHKRILSRKNRKIYYVYPCTWENKMRCLNTKGRLAICADVHHISEDDIHGIRKASLIKNFARYERSLLNRTDITKSDNQIWKAMMLPLLWLNYSSPSSKKYENISKNEETVLCTHKERNDTLIQCDEDECLKPCLKACINLKLGEMDDCQSLNVQDTPLHLCREDSSNKLKICGGGEKFYLCYQNQWNFGNEKNPVLQCSDVKRHICVDKEEGILHYCSMSGLSRITRKAPENNYSAEELFWIDYWMEWAHPDVEQSVKDPDLAIKLLCFTDNNDLDECSGSNPSARACTSASKSYVGRCKDLSDSEKAVPICMERHSEKLITCGKFPRGYLCYPPDGHLKPKLPCHDESRHVCYTDGFVQNCLTANFYKARRQDRRMIRRAVDTGNYTLNPHPSNIYGSSLLLENLKSLELKNDTGDTSEDFVFLCKFSNIKYGECKENDTGRQLCVNLTLQKIDECDVKGNMSSTPICKQVYTNRIRTCEVPMPSFICINNETNYSIMHSCNSSYDYLCLNETDGFLNCKNFTELAQIYTESQTTLESTLRNQIRQTDQIPMELLCSTPDGKFIQCIDNPYISVTCISTKNWNLLSCEEAEDKSEIGIPVCVQSNSSRLMTCDTFTHGTLCFSSDNNTTTLKPCEISSVTTCVTNDGVLKDCSQLFDRTKVYSRNNTGEIMMFNIERNFDGFEYLCFDDKSQLTVCSSNQTHSPACFSSINGIINPCNETEPYAMPIPICREILSNEIITCGKFNKVNICRQRRNATSYIPCASSHMYVCLIDGKIEKCSSKRTIIKKTRSLDSVDESNALSIENNKNVYLKDFEWNGTLFQLLKPLCENDLHLVLCGEATSFACFGVESGKIRRCDDFNKSDTISTLYLDVKNKINIASRNIFRNYLCISKELGNIYICSKKEKAACLQNGSIIKCRNETTDMEQTGYLIKEEFQKRADGPKEITHNIQTKTLNVLSFKTHNDETHSLVVDPIDYEEIEKKAIEYIELDGDKYKHGNSDGENVKRSKRSTIKILKSKGNEKHEDSGYSNVVIKYERLGNSKGYIAKNDAGLQSNEDNGYEDSYYTDNGNDYYYDGDYDEDDYDDEGYFYDYRDDYYYYDDDDDYYYDDGPESLSLATKRQNENKDLKANLNDKLSIYVYICSQKNNPACSQKGSTVIDKNEITEVERPVEQVVNSDLRTIINQTKERSRKLQVKDINVISFTDYNKDREVKYFSDDIEPTNNEGIKDEAILNSTPDEYNIGLDQNKALEKRSARAASTTLKSGDIYTNYDDDLSKESEQIPICEDGQTPETYHCTSTPEREPPKNEINSMNEITARKNKTDEKFMRIICNKCSIDNTLVVVGTPADVLPEAEVITFSP